MADEFNPGDLVVLKSGGPTMTVESTDKVTNQVQCVWFEKNRQNRGDFPVITLRKYQRPTIRMVPLSRG